MTAVDIWTCDISDASALEPQLIHLLSSDERARADRFALPSLRASFISTRGLTRRILAKYLQCSAQEIAFQYGEFGKPFLEAPHFNVAHSGSMLCVAVSSDSELGVDIEKIKPMRDALSIANRFFSPTESARLHALPPPLQTPAFFECWTRKEAFVKATGQGLRRGLQNFSVAFGPGVQPKMEQIENPQDDPTAWSLLAFEPADGYLGAVALRAQNVRLKLFSAQGGRLNAFPIL
jgi:4'-phosphopantetheinyl transferase